MLIPQGRGTFESDDVTVSLHAAVQRPDWQDADVGVFPVDWVRGDAACCRMICCDTWFVRRTLFDGRKGRTVASVTICESIMLDDFSVGTPPPRPAVLTYCISQIHQFFCYFSQSTDWEERPRNDQFCVEWDVQPTVGRNVRKVKRCVDQRTTHWISQTTRRSVIHSRRTH